MALILPLLLSTKCMEVRKPEMSHIKVCLFLAKATLCNYIIIANNNNHGMGTIIVLARPGAQTIAINLPS